MSIKSLDDAVEEEARQERHKLNQKEEKRK